MHVIREFFLQKVLFTLEKAVICSLWQKLRHWCCSFSNDSLHCDHTDKTDSNQNTFTLEKEGKLVFKTFRIP